MSVSPGGSWEKGARDPRHVLVMLDPGWPGIEAGQGGLSTDALMGSLAWHGFIAHRASTAEGARAVLRGWPIGGAILDLEMAPQELYPIYEAVHSTDPVIPCLLLGPAWFQSASRQRSALDRLDEFVRVDETCTTECILLYLRATILRAYPNWERPRSASSTQHHDEAAARANELISVFSVKGGTGKTTVACNLAISLATQRKKSVCLVDGDLYFGDIDVQLGLPAGSDGRRRSLHTVVDALSIPGGLWDERCEQALANFDQKLLDDVLHKHPSGVRVLPAPPRPEMAERIPPEVVHRAVQLCRQVYDYTIVDVPSSYSEPDIHLLDVATQIVVVLKPEMSIVRNTTLFLDYAAQFGWKDKLVLVLNRADSHRFTQIPQAAVEQHLAVSVIPVVSSGLVPQAASEGRALVEAYPDSKVAMSLQRLAEAIDGNPDQPTAEERGLRKLLPGRATLRKGATAAGL